MRHWFEYALKAHNLSQELLALKYLVRADILKDSLEELKLQVEADKAPTHPDLLAQLSRKDLEDGKSKS